MALMGSDGAKGVELEVAGLAAFLQLRTCDEEGELGASRWAGGVEAITGQQLVRARSQVRPGQLQYLPRYY